MNTGDFPGFDRALSGGTRDALFGLSENFPKVVEIDLGRIEPNPDQPRRTFDPAALQELAASIERHGLLSPIAVRPIENDRYLLIAGERRFRAHQLLGRATIFAIVTAGDPAELAIIENLQRENLNPIDQADAIARLMERHGYGQEEAARVVGKARNTVTALLALTRLPQRIKDECPTSDVSKSVLIEIARLPREEDQLRMWDDAKAGRARTVRAARAHKDRDGDGAVRTPQSPATKLLATGRSFARRLHRLAADPGALNRDQVRELRDLGAQIGELVEGLAIPE